MVTTRRRTGLLSVVVVAVLATACGGGNGDEEPRTLTPGDLERALPSPTELGDGWEHGEVDQTSRPPDLVRNCPPLATFGSGDGETVEQGYRHPDGRHIAISLDPASPVDSEEEVDELVAAIDACEDAEVEGPDGEGARVSFESDTTDAYGDKGIRLSITTVYTGPDHDGTEVHTEARAYHRAGVGVLVVTTDGLGDGGHAPSDLDQLDSLAAQLDATLESLLLD